MLRARLVGDLFALEAAASSRCALARLRGVDAGKGGVSLLRQLPWDQKAVEVEPERFAEAHAGVPTHLLYGSRAYAIGNSPLVLGSQQSDGERIIVLDSDMPGVSRRHCSLTRRNGQCVLEDHSRYGTFLNGHRINGSAVPQVGDALRLGSPGFEFRLITTDENHG